MNLYAYVDNDPVNFFDTEGLDYLDCLAGCIKANDPMEMITDAVVGKFAALAAGGGMPKTWMAIFAEKVMGDKKLARTIRKSLKMKEVSPIGCRPSKIIALWITNNREIATKYANINTAVLAVYGVVLSTIENECGFYCICKDYYDGVNILNVKYAIDFLVNKLTF